MTINILKLFHYISIYNTNCYNLNLTMSDIIGYVSKIGIRDEDELAKIIVYNYSDIFNV